MMLAPSRRGLILVALAGVAASVSSAALAGGPGGPVVTVVAYNGQAAPGITDATISSLNNNTAPWFSDTGELAFTALLTGTGVTSATNRALYFGAPGSLTLVAQRGGTAPGFMTETINVLSDFLALTSDGQTLAGALSLTTGGSVGTANDAVIYAGDPLGTILTAAREGNAAPGIPGVTYGPTLSTVPRLSNSGQIIFGSNLVGTGVVTANDTAVFAGPVSAPALLLREGSQAPGFPAGINVSAINSVHGLTPSGQALLQVDTTTNSSLGVTASSNNALYFGTAGSLTLVARSGTQAATFGTGVNYGSGTSAFSDRAVDADGLVVFKNSLSGVTPSGNNVTLFAGPGSNPAAISVLGRRGEPVPGLPDVQWFNFTSSVPAGSGRVFSAVSLQGTGTSSGTDTAIVLFEAGTVTILAREGDEVPGLPGIFLGQISNVSANANGTIVWNSALTGAVAPADDAALFMKKLGQPIQVLLREGDSLEVAPGDIRTIDTSTVNFNVRSGNSGNHGQGSADIGLNASDQVAVRVGISGPSIAFLVVGFDDAPPACVADFNGDGALNDDDLGEFITSFFEIFPGPGGYATTPCPDAEPPFNADGFRADITEDCSLNDDDLGLYITLFFMGCE